MGSLPCPPSAPPIRDCTPCWRCFFEKASFECQLLELQYLPEVGEALPPHSVNHETKETTGKPTRSGVSNYYRPVYVTYTAVNTITPQQGEMHSLHSLPLSLLHTQTHRDNIYTYTKSKKNQLRAEKGEQMHDIFMHIKHQTRFSSSFCISPTHCTCTGVAKHHRVKWQSTASFSPSRK